MWKEMVLPVQKRLYKATQVVDLRSTQLSWNKERGLNLK